jgi:hypothetical protein
MCTSGASYSVNGRSGIMYAGAGNWKNRKSDTGQSVGTADIED